MRRRFRRRRAPPAPRGPNGNKALVIEDEKISCFNPVPLSPREVPRVIVPIARSDQNYGTFFVQDVYKGIEDKGIERGRAKAPTGVELYFDAKRQTTAPAETDCQAASGPLRGGRPALRRS